MKKKKILMVANYQEQTGGISAVVENLSEGLSNDGYEVDIYSVFHKVPVVRIVRYVLLFFRIPRYQVIHAHGCTGLGFLPILISSVICGLCHKESRATFHGSIESHDFITKSMMVRIASMFVSLFSTPSIVTTGYFNSRGIKSVTIPNIFNKGDWKFERRDVIRPLLICTRSKYKPELVIKAFRLVKRRYKGAKLYMCGSLPSDDVKRKYCTDNLFFVGQIKRSLLKKYLDRSDIYVNSLATDSFGYSIYEAISMGLAVVSVESRSLRNSLGEDVIYFTAEDVNELSQGIIQLLQNQDKSLKMIQRGQRRLEKFSWEKLSPLWENFFDTN